MHSPTLPANALPSRPRRRAGAGQWVGHARPRLQQRRPLWGRREAVVRPTPSPPVCAGRQVFRFASLARLPRLAPCGRPRSLAVGPAAPGAGVSGGSGDLANLASLRSGPNRTNASGGFPGFQVSTLIGTLDTPAVVAEARRHRDRRAAVELTPPTRSRARRRRDRTSSEPRAERGHAASRVTFAVDDYASPSALGWGWSTVAPSGGLLPTQSGKPSSAMGTRQPGLPPPTDGDVPLPSPFGPRSDY